MSNEKVGPLSVLRSIRDLFTLSSTDRLVLVNLVLHANQNDGWKCWPSTACLSRETGFEITTVRRSLKRLQASGYINRKKRRSRSDLIWVNANKVVTDGKENKAETRRRNLEINEEESGSIEVSLPILGETRNKDAELRRNWGRSDHGRHQNEQAK